MPTNRIGNRPSAEHGRNGQLTKHAICDYELIRRLEGCQRDVEVWQRILQVRSLVLTPNEDMETWINFADLCRTSDRLNLAEKTLTSLVGASYNALDPEVGTQFSYQCTSQLMK